MSGLVLLTYRLHGTVCQSVLPADVAETALQNAKAAGADYHCVQGTWDSTLRKHVLPHGADCVVLEPQHLQEFQDLEAADLLGAP